jgi:hypothetical protein
VPAKDSDIGLDVLSVAIGGTTLRLVMAISAGQFDGQMDIPEKNVVSSVDSRDKAFLDDMADGTVTRAQSGPKKRP